MEELSAIGLVTASQLYLNLTHIQFRHNRPNYTLS